jgi:hypothetical protein
VPRTWRFAGAVMLSETGGVSRRGGREGSSSFGRLLAVSESGRLNAERYAYFPSCHLPLGRPFSSSSLLCSYVGFSCFPTNWMLFAVLEARIRTTYWSMLRSFLAFIDVRTKLVQHDMSINHLLPATPART